MRRGERIDGWTVFAVVATTVVAVADILAGPERVLIGLLVVGPLLAALRTTPLRTALVALYAMGLGIAAGAWNEIFLESDHLLRGSAVLFGSVLAVVIAIVRADRDATLGRLAAQYAVARILSEARDLRSAAPQLLEAIASSLEWEFSALWEIGAGGTELHSSARWCSDELDAAEFSEETARRRFRRGEGMPGRVWAGGDTVWVEDVTKDDNFPRAPWAERAGLCAAVGFPVQGAGEVLGVIEFFTRASRPPNQETLDQMSAFGRQIGQFVERKRAERAVEASRDQLEVILAGVADGITAQRPNGDLVYANAAAAEVLGFGSPEELLEAPVEITSRFDLMDEDGERFPLERLPGRRALAGEEPEPVTVRFLDRDTGEERWSVVKSRAVSGTAGTPLLAINIFEDITEQKRAEVSQRYLAEASRVLAGSLDERETLRRLADLAVPAMAEWCSVHLRLPGGAIEQIALAHQDPERLAAVRELVARYPPDPDDEAGAPEVIRTGQSQLYPQIPEELLVQVAKDDAHLEFLHSVGMRSAILVPLAARGRILGSLNFVTGAEGRRYDEDDLALAEELGRRAGLAIDNARLYSENENIARTLQASLLPPMLPDIPRLEAASRFRAAGAGQEVGGDFYDLFRTGTGEWAVVIGDVCGKGPEAAAVTALARYTLRAAAVGASRPAEVLQLLNDAILRQRSDGRFCSVAYAALDTDGNGAGKVRACVANGGHPLPLVLRRDGRVETVGDHGTLIGIIPSPEVVDSELDLEPGDAIVFYTDGVVEVRGAEPGQFDEDELSRVLGECRGLDADGIARRIESAVLAACDEQPRDDIAIVVLKALT